jgi:DNA-binding response OmpR family regulator
MLNREDGLNKLELCKAPARVLILDERATDRTFLRLTLEGQGFEVVTCATVEAALHCLNMLRFDFVLVSQGTESFEGRPVLERAVELDRARPVAVLTRWMNVQYYAEAMRIGASDYLLKPISPADLLRFIRNHSCHPHRDTPEESMGLSA